MTNERVAWCKPDVFSRLPEKDDLALIGSITLLHARLDNQLAMLIADITCASMEDALKATCRENSSVLRERVRKLAKRRFGDGQQLVLLQALLERAEQLTQKRNELIHAVFDRALDNNEVMYRVSGRATCPAPTTDELCALATDLASLTDQIIMERFLGQIHDALKRTKSSPVL